LPCLWDWSIFFDVAMPDLFYDSIQTKMGRLSIAVDGQGRVCFVGFDNGEAILRGFRLVPARGRCDEAKNQLADYINGRRRSFTLEYVKAGTEFRKRVFAAIVSVPYGDVITYAELARRIGRPRAARAVGRALGTNRIAIVVPCHRVVPASGGAGGYRWGGHIKEMLLALERGRSDAAGRP
jgi:methylated-DNA-[protein]-cysteine S-methyltransferase